jgi:hypothetical protein
MSETAVHQTNLDKGGSAVIPNTASTKTFTDSPTFGDPPIKETPVQAAPITSLSELNALCQQKQKVEFDFNGKKCALEMRRLTPAEQAKIAEVVEAVMPPIQKGRTPEEDRVNTLDPEYRKKKSDAALRGRSLALYWAVPAISSGRPGLTDQAEICSYVQGQLTEPILNLLWNATQESDIRGDVGSLVNFT